MNIEELHSHILYPMVRVRHAKAGGSGTVVFSEKDKMGQVHTYILTNYHVIAELVKIKEEWDAYLGRNIKRELRETAYVDYFRYQRLSYKVGEEQTEADIVAWHERQDIALLKLRDEERQYEYTARLSSREKSRNLHLFEEVYAVGAALLHSPYPTKGHLSSIADEIDNYAYQMSNAPITYGNSGGAVFLAETGEFIGIPSRVALQGWTDVANHMGFFIPWWRIADWLDREDFGFIFDPHQTLEACTERKEERRRRGERLIERERLGLQEDENAETPKKE